MGPKNIEEHVEQLHPSDNTTLTLAGRHLILPVYCAGLPHVACNVSGSSTRSITEKQLLVCNSLQFQFTFNILKLLLFHNEIKFFYISLSFPVKYYVYEQSNMILFGNKLNFNAKLQYIYLFKYFLRQSTFCLRPTCRHG